AAAAYAAWNRRGVTLRLRVGYARPASGSPVEDLPDHVLRTGPMPAPVFEGDGFGVEIGLRSRRGTRGPVWAQGTVGGERIVAATRAGSSNELLGSREDRPGDSLRRIHWRSSAKRGELVVREYEPPGVQTLAIVLDRDPPSVEVADQMARIAASEAWDCLREGGRVVLWAPDAEPLHSRGIWSVLEWLARYPSPGAISAEPAAGQDVVAITAGDQETVETVELARARGARVRAWLVGDGHLDVDVPIERVGTSWPI